MLSFKKILVPYDGSDHAKKALSMAVSLAEASSDATLMIATVSVPESPVETIAKQHGFVFENTKPDPAHKNPGQLILDEAASLVPDAIKPELILRVGNPGSTLLTLSYEKIPDLIVVGNRGRGTIESLLMGSVSSHLVSNARCTVLVVK